MALVRARLVGGLGNQMFIAATAAELATKLNTAYLLAPVGRSVHHHGRSSALDLYPSIAPHVDRAAHMSLPLALQRQVDRFLPNVFSEGHFGYDARFIGIRRPVRLSGYFQSAKYFPSQDVRELFALGAPNQRLERIHKVVGTKFRAVHVRRGDYTSPESLRYHGLCGPGYFSNALEVLSECSQSLPTVIFTDQPQALPRALQKIADLVLGPEEGAHEALDVDAMSHASALVLSNSSFSWWAAFLGDRKGRSVVAPRPWLRSGDLAASDLLLPHWLTLGAN